MISIPICKPAVFGEEADAVRKVVFSTWLNEGRKVAEFEERFASYIGTRYAVGFFNGTVALHATLLALGIGKGDEVIVPSFTFISTVTSVLHANAKPVFADIEPLAMAIDPQDVLKRITKRTKAVVAVHYAGQSSDVEALKKIAKAHKLFFIEDAAEAHGATFKGKKVGVFGNAAMFSFTPTKVITTGEGGVITTDDRSLSKKLRLLKNHGQDKPYHHTLVGYNYRMTEMQAAIGLCQLARLEKLIYERRQKARFFDEKLSDLPGITVPYEAPERRHVYMMYTIGIDEAKAGVSRDKLIKILKNNGIMTRIYFPPAHKQPAFDALRLNPKVLPVTERVADEVVSLPIYPSLTAKEMRHITDTICGVVRNRGKD